MRRCLLSDWASFTMESGSVVAILLTCIFRTRLSCACSGSVKMERHLAPYVMTFNPYIGGPHAYHALHLWQLVVSPR